MKQVTSILSFRRVCPTDLSAEFQTDDRAGAVQARYGKVEPISTP